METRRGAQFAGRVEETDFMSAPSMLVLGLMSGTSADGINVALAKIGGAAPRIPAKLESFVSLPFPHEIRAAVLRVAEGRPTTTGAVSQLNVPLGDLFAPAALKACRKL